MGNTIIENTIIGNIIIEKKYIYTYSSTMLILLTDKQ